MFKENMNSNIRKLLWKLQQNAIKFKDNYTKARIDEDIGQRSGSLKLT